MEAARLYDREGTGLCKTNPKHVIAALTLLLIAIPRESTAQEYPWCARYSWSTYNCGFVNLHQCRATIHGVGGVCERNPRYMAQPRRNRR